MLNSSFRRSTREQIELLFDKLGSDLRATIKELEDNAPARRVALEADCHKHALQLAVLRFERR